MRVYRDLLSNKETQLTLDTAKMMVNESGVDPFAWPVARKETLAAADLIVETWVDILGEATSNGHKEAGHLATLGTLFLLEAQAIFQAHLLACRLMSSGSRPRLPPGAEFWHAAFEGRVPRGSPYLKSLRHGLKSRPKWWRFMRPLWGLVSKDVFSRRPVELIDVEHDIVSIIAVCPLTLRHAKARSERVVVCPLDEWFAAGGLEDIDERRLAGAHVDLVASVVQRVVEGFAARGCQLPAHLIIYMRGWLEEASAWVKHYGDKLRRSPQRLPKTLWIGTGGLIWARILADAVRENGGTVVGHDHALGANYSRDTLAPFVDLQPCDDYVTFSDAQALLYRDRGRTQVVGRLVPRVYSISEVEKKGAKTAKLKFRRLSSKPTKVETILYVTPFYTYDTIGPRPLMPAIVAVDWQARLFCLLRQMGYSVCQKPHPESRGVIPGVFESKFGVKQLQGRLEDVYCRADLLLFDWTLTTTFGFALRTDMPIVLIDFGSSSYSQPEIEMLGRRCAIVSGWYDQMNRAHVDPDRLADAIAKAPTLGDSAFAEAVFGSRL